MTAIRVIDDHTELVNIGSNTHAEIDAYIARALIKGVTSYKIDSEETVTIDAHEYLNIELVEEYIIEGTLEINGNGFLQVARSIGSNSHSEIDAHIADVLIHFRMLDEDNFASNSATKTATQQSIKGFVETRSINGGNF